MKIIIASNPNYMETENIINSFLTCPFMDVQVIGARTATDLEGMKGETIFFVFWNDRIPSEVIQNNRCISFHTAPLPKYRGGNPIQNQMLDGKAESEVCSFITSEGMDAGAVLLRTPISLLGNIDDVFREIARAVTMQITGILLNNPVPVMQGGEPTFCKRLTEEEKEIKPYMTVEYADALVRGFNGDPYTPAYVTMKDGRKLYILRTATMTPADMLKGLNAVADAKVCREEEKRAKT